MVDQFSQDEARIARLLEECRQRYTAGEYAAARREAETVLMLDEENATAQVMAAGRSGRGGARRNRSGARIVLPGSRGARTFNADTHFALGRFLLLSDRPTQARERLERAAERARH